MRESKLVSLSQAVSLIENGSILGLGGNTLNRAPMAAVMEIVSQGKKDLHLVKTAGGMDIDALCLGECVSSVDAGFVSFETQFSLAQNYRKAVQEGKVKGNEHACYTVISALRAAEYGIPFMPVFGLKGTQLVEAYDYFAEVTDPFTGEKINAVKAIRPDWVIVHAHYADELGNAYIGEPMYEDVLMAKAARHVIVTAEHLVSTERLRRIGTAQIPRFLVDAVVSAPEGARPCACEGDYGINERELKEYKELKSADELRGYIMKTAKYRQPSRIGGGRYA